MLVQFSNNKKLKLKIVLLDRDMPITTSDGGRIVEVPYLYRLDRKAISTDMIDGINIRRYLQ